MRVGLVSIWCHRGQATVARQIAGALEGLGHETFVLAKPAIGDKRVILEEGVWAHPRLTRAPDKRIPAALYLEWAERNRLDVCLFDQNYQFGEIAQLRAAGVRTVGRFVWERFRAADVAGALAAFDAIYSLTRCEQRRYRDLGIDAPFVRWGCHPEAIARARSAAARGGDPVFLFPAAGKRKRAKEALEAFRRHAPASARLVVKSYERVQAVRIPEKLLDERVEWIHRELDLDAYHALNARCDVCLAPSAWEGLGLHLFEAIAHGMPVIAIDVPPVNEFVQRDKTGILVPGVGAVETPSGVPAYGCSVDDLGAALRRLCDPDTRAAFRRETLARRDFLSWDKTVEDLGALLERVA